MSRSGAALLPLLFPCLLAGSAARADEVVVRVVAAASSVPLPRAQVLSSSGASWSADEGGLVRLPVPPAIAEASVRAPGFVPTTIRLPDIPLRVSVALEPEPRLAGVVVDPEGAPVAGAEILVDGAPSGVVGDGDGRFELDMAAWSARAAVERRLPVLAARVPGREAAPEAGVSLADAAFAEGRVVLTLAGREPARRRGHARDAVR